MQEYMTDIYYYFLGSAFLLTALTTGHGFNSSTAKGMSLAMVG